MECSLIFPEIKTSRAWARTDFAQGRGIGSHNHSFSLSIRRPMRNHELGFVSATRFHPMPFGAEVGSNGIRFRLFAPDSQRVNLSLEGSDKTIPMLSRGDGWYEITTTCARPGTRYTFVLEDESEVPDPASRYQPKDLDGPSEVIDPREYAWHDGDWKGRPWEETVLYELHIGTYTKEGTFESAASRLGHLEDLGITAVELMCVADFSGNRNWGYDGALFYAPDSAYGRPHELKAFIDQAHAHGIMVIMDVVYNHFGPEGNQLPAYFPEIASEHHQTPWGKALNFDGLGSKEVREFVIHNALYWIEEFHVDGLRIDASHTMIDESSYHILDEMKDRIRLLAGNRHVHLILESEMNVADRLRRGRDGEPVGYAAQWNHAITHLLTAVLGKTCADRQVEDAGETERLAKALAEGFVVVSKEKASSTSESQVPPSAFICFTQTHDLVGNRILGDRIHGLVSPTADKAIVSICLLLPQIPMLFMGEEWAATTPFPYFCDFHGNLASKIRKGRLDQLSKLDPAPSAEEIENAPDPQADGTFRSAQLDWCEVAEQPHADRLKWYRSLLETRREMIVSALKRCKYPSSAYKILGPGALLIRWNLSTTVLQLEANLCASPTKGFRPSRGTVIWTEGAAFDGEFGPWTTRYSVETPRNLIEPVECF
jgi:malto-oligosyltrehalose trehalohydrolase